eukprot:GFUD01025590.1.p1 GENE.GFUD01025590.1~~GFUD01025590.1.p1  ORF type:complete len:336 (-),score=83.54 GFUD01025590.1:23-1030(-)
MGSSEKFCLRWNDFESNISNAFKELRDDKEFFDVTLACDDEQIQAHKVILSACSPFFRSVLRRNPHQHPLLYMKGVKYTDLQSVLNFMYHGEVNVAQEELNSFLAVAEDLKVKGLTQNLSENHQSSSRQSTSYQPSKSPSIVPSRVIEKEVPPIKRPRPPPVVHDTDDIQEVVPIKAEPRDSAPMPSPHVPMASPHVPQPAQPQVYSRVPQPVALDTEEQSVATYEETGYEDYGDYQEQVYNEADNSMDHTMAMQGASGKGNGTRMFQDYVTKLEQTSGWKCTICGKESAQKVNLVKHVENIHFPDTFSYECKYCGKTFNSKNSMYIHVSRTHKN